MAASAESGGVLELTAGTDRIESDWVWDGSTNTLMLLGVTFDDCVWLKVESATLVLEDGTENIMRGGIYDQTSADNHGDGFSWSAICVGTTNKSGQQQNFSVDGALTITIDDFGTISFCGNDFARLLANIDDEVARAIGTALYLYGAAARECF